MTKISLELNPFEIPHHVTLKQPIGQRQEGFSTPTQIPTTDIDVDILQDMCDRWVEMVFVQAGKTGQERQ